MTKNNELLEKIGFNFKVERIRQKITQEKLAEMANISINCLSNIENARQDSRISTLNALAIAMNCDLKDFL